MFQVVLWTFGKTASSCASTGHTWCAWRTTTNLKYKKMTRCWVDGGQFYMWIIPDIWKEEYEINSEYEWKMSNTHHGICRFRDNVIRDYEALRVMSFGIMSHWGLCRIQYSDVRVNVAWVYVVRDNIVCDRDGVIIH